jgi:GNAT superfamily N-acetyltransferase
MAEMAYRTEALDARTWLHFARLVDTNNGVWGGCWCMGFHVDGLSREGPPANRAAKEAHVRAGTVHQVLVYEGTEAVGWCQFGPPAEVATIKNQATYAQGLASLPDWRIGCMFTGKGHRGAGVGRAALAGALAEVRAAGGGVVEGYPEQVEDRPPQRGSYFHTGPETLFEEFGFVRDRRIAKWRWVMRLTVAS